MGCGVLCVYVLFISCVIFDESMSNNYRIVFEKFYRYWITIVWAILTIKDSRKMVVAATWSFVLSLSSWFVYVKNPRRAQILTLLYLGEGDLKSVPLSPPSLFCSSSSWVSAFPFSHNKWQFCSFFYKLCRLLQTQLRWIRPGTLSLPARVLQVPVQATFSSVIKWEWDIIETRIMMTELLIEVKIVS